MKDFLAHILKSMLGDESFDIKETGQDSYTAYTIKVPQESMGMVIGKKGKVINAIRSLMKVKATLEKSAVGLSVEESTPEPKG